MKSKPTKSKNLSRSLQVLNPASLGIKKSKSDKNDLKKKVRFNLKVKNSSSEDMLCQRCLLQPLFRAECKAFELKSQSNTDVAGCSKMSNENLRQSSSCSSNIFHTDKFVKLHRNSANDYQIVGLENGDLLRHLFNLQNNLPRKGILKNKCSQNLGIKCDGTFQSYEDCWEKKLGSLGSLGQIPSFPLEEQTPVSTQRDTTEFLKLYNTPSIYLPLSNEKSIGKDVFEGASCENLTSSINSLHISGHASSESLIPKTYASKQMLLSVNPPLVCNLYHDENLKLKVLNSNHKEQCYRRSYSMDEQMPWTDKFIHNSNNNANSSGPQKANSEILTQDQNHNNQTTQCATFRETSDQGRNGLPSETCKSAANQSGNSSQQDGHTIDHLNVGLHTHCSSNISYQGEMFSPNSPRVLNSSVSSRDLSFPSHVKEVVLKSQTEILISKDNTNLVSGNVTCGPSILSVRDEFGAVNPASDKIPHFSTHQNQEETQTKTTDLSVSGTTIMATSPDYEKKATCEKQVISLGVNYVSDSCHSKGISCISNKKTNRNYSCDSNSTSNNLYRCPILNCSMHFSNQELLLKHLSTMKHAPCHPMSTLINGTLSNQKPNFLCPLCGSIFLDEDKCFDHMLRQNHFRLMSPVSTLVFSCPQCLCFFQSLSKTLQHMDDLNHYNTAFSFEGDRENLNRASPIPVPYRLMIELIARCEKVTYVLYCQDCHSVLESPDQLKAHLNKCHMVISKCCKSVADVFSSLITDQACAECHQYIYQGLPATGLCIHTDCPLQGPVLALRARSLKEFFLRCGIADINVATENNLDTSPNTCASVSETCTSNYSGSVNAKAHSSQFYDYMLEQSNRSASLHRFKKNVESDQLELSCLTRSSPDNPCLSISGQTLAAVALTPVSSHILHNNVASASLSTDKEMPPTKKTVLCPSSEGTSQQQVLNSSIHDLTSAVERRCPSADYLQATCSSNFSKQAFPSKLNQIYDSSSSDSTYKCSPTESETNCDPREKNSSSVNSVAADEDSCSCSNCQSSCSSSSCSSESMTSCESLTDVDGKNRDDKLAEAFQSVSQNVRKVSSRYQCSIFERESDGSLESEHYIDYYASLHHSSRGPDKVNEIYAKDMRKPMNPVREATPLLNKDSQYFTSEAVVNIDVDLFLGEDQTASPQGHNVKKQTQKPTRTKALQRESDMDTGQSNDSGLFHSDLLKDSSVAVMKPALKRRQDEDLEMPDAKKLKPAFDEGKHIQTDRAAFKTTESLYMVARGEEDGPERGPSFYTIDRDSQFKKRTNTRTNYTANRRYDTRNGSKRTGGISKASRWKHQFKNKQHYCTNNKINSSDKTISGKIKKKELRKKKKKLFGRKGLRCLKQLQNINKYATPKTYAQGNYQNTIDSEYKSKNIKNSKAEKKGANNLFVSMHAKKDNGRCQGNLCSLTKKALTMKQNSLVNPLTRKQAKAHRRQMKQKVSKNLNNCRTSKLQSKTTEVEISAQNKAFVGYKWAFPESGYSKVEQAAIGQEAGSSKINTTEVKDLGSCQTAWQQSLDVDIVDIDEIRDRFFIVNESLPFDESCFIIDDGKKLKNSTSNSFEKSKLKSPENVKRFPVEESSACVDQICYIKASSPEVKFNFPVLRSSKTKAGKNGFALSQNNPGTSKAGEKSIPKNAQSQPKALMDQVILRPRDKYMANQHMKSTTSTMSLPDEVSIVISDDDHFVVTAESHINQSYQTPDDRLQNSLRSSDKKLDLLSAVGKKRFTRRRRFQTNKSKKKNLHKSHYKASQGKGLFSQLNFRTARFKAADLKSTGQFHFPPLVAPSLMLRLDGPQCCSSHSERQLGSAKSQSTTTVPKSAHFKKLISPQINHLASMERIIFADLENVMFFKVFSGSLSPSTYVWGFISARPNTPFHLEQYFCKYPLYNYLKDADCVHISTEIGTSKDAVDFAMCLAIAKLDDRLPASIPFFIVSRDRGFREVENQMRASHRLVKVISPQGWSISDLDFKL